MRLITLPILLALCVMARPVIAQETLVVSASAQPAQIQEDDPAEAAWQNLRSQLAQGRAPLPQDASAPALSQTQQQVSLSTQVAQAATGQPRQASDWAAIAQESRDFLAQYPSSPHAPEARKMELTAELVPLDGAGNIPPAVEAQVKAYLADATVPASARFEVSAMHKNARIVLQEGMSRDEVMAQRLQNAHELVSEFPKDSRAWVSLLNGAQFTPGQAAVDAADEIINSPDAPNNIKQAAQTLLNGRALLDKPIGCVDLSFAENQPVMIYFWSLQRPNFLTLFRYYQKINGIAFLGINVDGEDKRAQAEKIVTGLRLPGTQIYDGANGPLAKALYITKSPAVLLVDAQGILRDIDGTFNTLEKLKQMAGTSSEAVSEPTIVDQSAVNTSVPKKTQ